jgi:quercetin dioxygenase-like cupin family protein
MTVEPFRDIRQAVRFRPDKVGKNSLFASERMFCDVYAFEPGQAQPSHRHASSDKLYCVLEGTGVFSVDGRRTSLGPGKVAFCPAGSEHSVANSGSERLVVLVVMAPPPDAEPATPGG